MEKRRCDECESTYFATRSEMLNLCPECAHQLYGYENCKHTFKDGRCTKCYWDGSTSEYLKTRPNNKAKLMKLPLGIKKVSVLCILQSGEQFLLLKRKNPPNQGLYTPVGGKLDPFETPLQAALRETKEETGIELDDMTFCGILTETSPTKYNWICYTYLAEIPYQEAPPCDEGTLEWIAFDVLSELPTPKTDWHIYDYSSRGQSFIFEAEYDADLQLLKMKELLLNQDLLIQ